MKKFMTLLLLFALTACSGGTDKDQPKEEVKTEDTETKDLAEDKKEEEKKEEEKSEEDNNEELPPILFDSIIDDVEGQKISGLDNAEVSYDLTDLESYEKEAKNIVLAKLIDKEDEVKKEEGDLYPKTRVKIEVLDSFKGEMEKGETSIYLPGALLSYDEYISMGYTIPNKLEGKSEEDLKKYNYIMAPNFYIPPKKEQVYIFYLNEDGVSIGDGLGSFELVGNRQDAFKFIKAYEKTSDKVNKEKTSFTHSTQVGPEKFTFAEILDTIK